MNDRKALAVFSLGSKTWPALLVCLTLGLSFWQLSTFQLTLKYDALDITLPWRYFTADALRNGVLPWWNPYQLQGFAHGTSPETWYPIGILLGLWRGYDLITLNLEYLLHLVLSAWGFYRLGRSLGFQSQSTLFGALVFPMTGFFVGHAQHMGWIIAGAWIPHVLASLIYFNKDFDWRYAISFVLCTYMLGSGGYPGLTICTGYLIGIIVIRSLFLKANFAWRKVAIQYLRLTLLTVSTCAIIISCFLLLKQNLWRGQGLQGEASLVGSSFFKHLISLLFPLSTVKGNFDFWHADQSVINSYVGLPTLLLLLIALKKWRKYGGFILLALVPLIFAMGEELPFRIWANKIPLWDLFRFPALFRYFFILGLLLVTVSLLDDYRGHMSYLRRELRSKAMWLATIFGLFSAYFLIFDFATVLKVLHLSIQTVKEAIAFQTLFILIWSLSFYFALRFLHTYSIHLILLVGAVIDLGFMVQTNGRVSVFSERPLREMQMCLKALPEGFPKPSLLDPIGTNEDRALNFGSIYRNTSTLFKQISWDGYSPFQYKGYVALNNSVAYQSTLNRPFAYLSFIDPRPDSLDYYSSRVLSSANDELSIERFSANEIEFNTKTAHPRLVVINQNHLKGWCAEINGSSLPVEKVDVNLMGLRIPQGTHAVRLYFDSGLQKNTLLISSILLLALVFILAMIYLPGTKLIIALLLPMVYLITGDLLHSSGSSQIDTAPSTGKLTIVNEIDQISSFKPNIADRFLDWRDFQRFRELIRNQNQPFLYKTRRLCKRKTIFTDYLGSKWIDSMQMIIPEVEYLVYPRSDSNRELATFNGFEGYAKAWKDLSNILYENNGNAYQKIDSAKFSATWVETLNVADRDSFLIRLKVATRAADAAAAGLVYSVVKQDQVQVWKSHPLKKDQKPEKWTTTTWQNRFTLASGIYQLRVQIWNPARKRLDIDDFDIEVLRQ